MESQALRQEVGLARSLVEQRIFDWLDESLAAVGR
jgi:ABC-type thiamine transport system ATPase subunit